MRVLLTGATGLIGRRLVGALRDRGDGVCVLSRDPDRASASLGVEALAWNARDPAPVAAAAPDAVVHLAGENVAQRWTARARRAIRDSRVVGTANLVAGMRAAPSPAPTLVSASAVGFYGSRGDERLSEDAPPGVGFLAEVCVDWEREALLARELGARVVLIRTGVVLDREGGALKKMLPPFRAGLGGPVAGGGQYLAWIDADDVVGLYLAALDDERYSGPLNAAAPEPVTNREFSRALGRVLRRPAVVPVPAIAVHALFGEMATIVTGGQRAIPARALALGHEFRRPELVDALAAALSG